jgi:hypothetical protein
MDTIVLSLLIVMALILLYIGLEGAFSGVTNFSYNSDLNVQQSSIPVSSIKEPNSKNFAYGMWLMLNDGEETDVMIFKRDSELEIKLSGGSLKLKINDVDINVIDNYPFQKWVYLVTTVAYNSKVENDDTIWEVSTVDVYMNGKMVKSAQISPPINPSSDGIIFGSLDAKMIDFKRWTYALTPQMIMDEYEKSNMKKYLGGYGVDVSLLKNDIMAKRFSLF